MELPRFVNDQTFLALSDKQDNVAQLETMVEHLTKVHLLTANKFDSFDELIREYLKCGIDMFGLETGIVSEIIDNTYTVCDVVSPLEVLEKGQEFELKDTYCQLVYDNSEVIGLPEVGQLAYMNTHPVYQNLKLEAYLSAPIYVDDKLFGTLNFTSQGARKHGFSEHERTLISLLANSIGGYLRLRKKEEHLVALNNQIKKFVGYVSHDLRNPIGSIISLSKLAKRAQDDPARLPRLLDRIGSAAESALELVTTILDNAALGSGKLELHKKDIKLDELTRLAVDSVNEFASDAGKQVVVLTTPGASCELDANRIIQALNNLLINAIKYSPQGGRIRLSATETEEGTLFKVHNRSGLVEQNQSAEIDISSVGFGLEIVRNIVAAHGGKLQIEQADDSYEARFVIPGSPS